MKLYITKPKHTAYGSIKMDRYDTFESLLDNCDIWFFKPEFEKPFLCCFEGSFEWRGFSTPNVNQSNIKYNFLPEGEVKKAIRQVIQQSLNEDLSENIRNRHYKWIGEVDVDILLTNNKHEANFLLYMVKPSSVSSIMVRGIDHFKVFLHHPILKKVPLGNDDRDILSTNQDVYLSGKVFRKHPELSSILDYLWRPVIESFDVDPLDIENFYYNIKDSNHKKGQGPLEFILEVPLSLSLK